MGMPADPLGPIEQIATAPHVAIMVAKVAAARKTFAEVEIQGESSSSALTSPKISVFRMRRDELLASARAIS